MDYIIFQVFIAFIVSGSVLCSRDDDFAFSSGLVIDLEHAFSAGESATFSSRGSILLKSLKVSSGSTTKDLTLTSDEHEQLKIAAQEDGIYRIRTPAKIGEVLTPSSEDYVSTFVKACHLYNSHLTETITVSLDNSGNIIGLSIRSPNSTGCAPADQMTDLPSRMFNTTVDVDLQVAGAVPDTQTFIRRLEQAEAQKAAGKDKDNRSFLGKYWMYIVPVVLVMMLAGQQDPQEGGGGEG